MNMTVLTFCCCCRSHGSGEVSVLTFLGGVGTAFKAISFRFFEKLPPSSSSVHSTPD